MNKIKKYLNACLKWIVVFIIWFRCILIPNYPNYFCMILCLICCLCVYCPYLYQQSLYLHLFISIVLCDTEDGQRIISTWVCAHHAGCFCRVISQPSQPFRNSPVVSSPSVKVQRPKDLFIGNQWALSLAWRAWTQLPLITSSYLSAFNVTLSQTSTEIKWRTGIHKLSELGINE